MYLICTVLLTCLLCALPAGLWAGTSDTGTVTSMSLYLKRAPGSNGQALYEVARGTRLEIVSVEQGWAKVVYKGDTLYAAKRHLQIKKMNKETGSSALPGWVNKDEGEGKWDGMSYYFSTDRIMEALPDFGILRGKLPVDPDVFFHIAFWILLVTGILFPFIEGGIRYANVLYWLTYVLAMVTSVCEILYLLSSPDPLGFCDINNVWFGTALFYLLLCALALSQQMALFSRILFATQYDLDFDCELLTPEGMSFGVGYSFLFLLLPATAF